jgi:hypothetical protein
MNFYKFVSSETGKILMSMILGLGLATIFRASCKGKNCIIYHAAPLEEIKDKVYKIDKKCYKFNSTPVKCNPQKQIIDFA